jgi:hypothetical protein
MTEVIEHLLAEVEVIGFVGDAAEDWSREAYS